MGKKNRQQKKMQKEKEKQTNQEYLQLNLATGASRKVHGSDVQPQDQTPQEPNPPEIPASTGEATDPQEPQASDEQPWTDEWNTASKKKKEAVPEKSRPQFKRVARMPKSLIPSSAQVQQPPPQEKLIQQAQAVSGQSGVQVVAPGPYKVPHPSQPLKTVIPLKAPGGLAWPEFKKLGTPTIPPPSQQPQQPQQPPTGGSVQTQVEKKTWAQAVSSQGPPAGGSPQTQAEKKNWAQAVSSQGSPAGGPAQTLVAETSLAQAVSSQGHQGGPSESSGQRQGADPQTDIQGHNEPMPSPSDLGSQPTCEPDDVVPTFSKLALRDIIPLQPRNGLGTLGRAVALETNYFELRGLDRFTLHQHSLDVVAGPRGPLPFDQKLPLRLKRVLCTAVLKHFHDKNTATNYVNKLICTEPITEQTITVNDSEPGQNGPSVDYRVHIRFYRSFHFRDVLADLQSPEPIYHPEERNDAIQALNVVLAHYPNESRGIHPVGQSKHFAAYSHPTRLDKGLNALGGYFHSVRPTSDSLLLNVNFSAAAFYDAAPLQQLINAFDQQGRYFSDPQAAHRLNSFLKNLSVKIEYHNTPPKIRTISSVVFRGDRTAAKPSEVTFYRDGRLVTVSNHFRQAHNQDIQQNQVVLNFARHRNEIQLPAEVCTVIAGQAARQRLDSSQTTKMINFACRDASTNKNAIANEGLHLMGITTQSDQSPQPRFGIQVNTQLLGVAGRVLDTPFLQYLRGRSQPLAGSWNLKGNQFYQPGAIRGLPLRLGFLRIWTGQHDPGPTEDVFYFQRNLEQNMRSSGLGFTKVTWDEKSLNWDGYHNKLASSIDNLEKKIKSFSSSFNDSGAQLVVILLPSSDAQLFSRIKHFADVRHGVHTLCFRRKPKRNSRELAIDTSHNYLTNLSLKINLKLGGINHTLVSRGDALMRDTMFVGIDVTHPTGSESSEYTRSIAAVVANTDVTLGQWPGSIRAQERRQEIVSDLRDMVHERLSAWADQRNLPSRVVVYRDGVSESQYQQVLTNELPQVEAAIDSYFMNHPGQQRPQVTLLVVGKRHHTRFYPIADNDTGNQGNVLPGTVVDRGCTMERGFDFFMVAHQGIKGTSRPAHYVVLQDNNGYDANEMQRMTHNLCYVYGRATRAVSIASPAYLADRLCERGRCYLYDAFHSQGKALTEEQIGRQWIAQVHENVRSTMFYI